MDANSSESTTGKGLKQVKEGDKKELASVVACSNSLSCCLGMHWAGRMRGACVLKRPRGQGALRRRRHPRRKGGRPAGTGLGWHVRKWAHEVCRRCRKYRSEVRTGERENKDFHCFHCGCLSGSDSWSGDVLCVGHMWSCRSS
jgi:hypothetical protein